MLSFSFKSLAIPEVVPVAPKVFSDDRGYFLESFKSSDFSSNNSPYFKDLDM
jgi:dTDP-4-dehydrorhamnose 3,5-epimerase